MAERPRVERRRRRLAAISAGLGAVLLIIGGAAYHAVNESLEDLLGDYLEAVLQANARALELWTQTQLKDLSLAAANPQVVGYVEDLSRLLAGPPMGVRDRLAEAQAQGRLRWLLKPLLEAAHPQSPDDFPGFLIVDQEGWVLASDETALLARQLPTEALQWLLPVLRGEARVFRPVANIWADPGEPASPDLTIPIAAPIAETGELVSAAVVVFRELEDFRRILEIGRFGATGQALLFDRRGRLYSGVREPEELRELGLDPPRDGTRRLVLRDPGRRIRPREGPPDDLSSRPLTRMAASATTGESGLDLAGYRDVRGIRVVGAWTWLADLRAGLAVEMQQSEALKALRPMLVAFGGLFLALSVVAVVALISALKAARLQRKVEQVQQLGSYRLLEKIGQGGMGEVYLARHAMLRRPTAVKFLRPGHSDPEAVGRFEREVQLTSGLRHPNTVQIYDYGRTPEGIFYYAMEYLPGINLAQLIGLSGPVPAARVVAILRQLCGSLAEAHGRGIVHRDIKPMNVMLCALGGRHDVVKVLDFGLVKALGEAGDRKLTSAHVVPGTPAYVAPERLRDPLCSDARVDVYCVGAVAFNLLTARDVFVGESAADIAVQAVSSDAPSPGECTDNPIPGALDRLVLDCLARDPSARPRDAQAVLDRLASLSGLREWTEEQAGQWWTEHQQAVDALLPRALETAVSGQQPVAFVGGNET